MKIKKYFIPKKRSFIRLAAFSVAAIGVLSIFLMQTTKAADYYENETKTVRLRSLSQLCEYTARLPDDLRKLACSADSASEISANIIQNTSCAKICLSDFPQNNDSLSQIYKFYSQIDSLITSINDGNLSIEQEQATLRRLADCAQKLAYRLEDILSMCMAGTLSLTEIPDAIVDDEPPFYSSALDYADDLEENLQIDTFAQTKADSFLTNLRTITKDEAAEIAASFIDIEPVLLREKESSQNHIKLYNFYYRDTFISITKKGGKICSFLMPCESDESLLSAEEAIIRAKESLKTLGYTNMEESYYFINDNICTITFAYKDGDIICYPDLIKIKIALDNGETVGFDASDYLKNHKERNIIYEVPALDSLISDSLDIVNISPALISNEKEEILCHEILCYDGENEYMIYLNCVDGIQEKIFKLEKSANGTLIK